MSNCEVKELRLTFDTMDVDNTGKIESHEISSALKRLGMPVDDEKAKTMLREADTDGSGAICFEEFVRVVERARERSGSTDNSDFHEVIQSQRATVMQVKNANNGGSVHSFSLEESSAFCEFINTKLASKPELAYLLPMRDPQTLFASAADGVLLAHLINVAVPETIDLRVLNLNARYPIHRVENLNLTLNAAKSIGLTVVNIGPSDMMEGRPHLVLGLVWQLVKMSLLANINLKDNPNLIRLLQQGEELSDLLKLPPEQLLLRWFNYHLEKAGCKRRVRNYGSDLKDAEAYVTLLTQIDPERKCSLSMLRNQDTLARASYVVENGSRLGAEFAIKPGDIVAGNEKLNLGFVAALFNACPALEPPDEMPVFEDDDAGDTREERALRMWVNSLGLGTYVDSLFDGMRDGLVLLQIMDAVKPGVVEWSRACMAPNNVFEKTSNCNYAIDLALAPRAAGFAFSLVGVQGKDIVDGNKKLTLALIWQLRRYNLTAIVAALSRRRNESVSDDHILKWANQTVAAAAGDEPPLAMSSFADKSLSTGRFLVDLLAAVRPGKINRELITAGVTEAERADNAKYVLSSARKLGCTVFLVWEDLVEVKPKMVFSLVAAVMGLAYGSNAAAADIDLDAASLSP